MGINTNEPRPTGINDTMYLVGHHAIRTYTRLALDMHIEWHAPMPDGPKIITANHPTTTDPFYLLGLTSEPLSLLITQMAFDAPVFGSYLKAAGHIPVIKEKGRAAFDTALALLDSGRSIGIFPEGSLSPQEGGVARPRTGAARLALMTGVPVVPVGVYLNRDHIHSVDTTIEEHNATARWYPGGPYAMTVGAARTYCGDVADYEQVREIANQIMKDIAALAVESAGALDMLRQTPDGFDTMSGRLLRAGENW